MASSSPPRGGNGKRARDVNYKVDSRQRKQFVYQQNRRIAEKLRVVNESAGLEYVVAIYDPLTDNLYHDVTPGLEEVWAGNEPAAFIRLVHGHSRSRKLIAEHGRIENATWSSPLPFKEVPGGIAVQRKVAWAVLSLAVPGKRKSFFSSTTTHQFRNMKCEVSGISFESWPEEWPFKSVDEMDLDEMERVFKWCVKFVSSYDPLMLVNGLRNSKALRFPGNDHLSREGHYNLVARLVQSACSFSGS